MKHPSKIIHELGIAPLKKLGQNFQVDVHSVENAAAAIPENANILEIGPGLGAWTEVFLRRGHAMTLVEKDRTLAARLESIHAENSRVQVIEADFLECDLTRAEFSGVTAAIGNLPFYVTSDLLLRVVVDMPQVKHALFGVQLEVAERIHSAKGSSLAIHLQSQGTLRMVSRIARHSFYPAPQVDAALLSFVRSEAKMRPHLRELLKAAFWGKRKKLSSALKKNPFFSTSEACASWIEKLERLPERLAPLLEKRADEISVEEFCALYDFLMV